MGHKASMMCPSLRVLRKIGMQTLVSECTTAPLSYLSEVGWDVWICSNTLSGMGMSATNAGCRGSQIFTCESQLPVMTSPFSALAATQRIAFSWHPSVVSARISVHCIDTAFTSLSCLLPSKVISQLGHENTNSLRFVLANIMRDRIPLSPSISTHFRFLSRPPLKILFSFRKQHFRIISG